MARERRDHAADRLAHEAVLARRAAAPVSTKLESLLYALAESQGSNADRYNAVATVAGWVGDRANEGINLDGFTVVSALEAALVGAGVKL